MSQNGENPNQIVVIPPHLDFNQEQYTILRAYKEDGCPGISYVSDSLMLKWQNLYMAGKSYEEIARQTKGQLPQILLIAEKLNWPKKKSDYLNAISERLGERLLANRMESLVFLNDVQTYIHETIGKTIREYLETKNEDLIKKIDLKSLDKYYKAIETVEKLAFKKKDDEERAPAIFNNFFGKTSIKKTGPNSVEVEVSSPDDDISILELEAEQQRIDDEKD